MLLLLCSLMAVAADLYLHDARLWDGTGAPAVEGVHVIVQGGRIAAIGPDLTAPEGAQVLDARGATVLPGLIDAHVHLSMDPGAAWRQDSPQQHADLLRQHMAAYLACGVTAILDPAVGEEELRLIRGLLEGGAPGPRYLTLGTPFSPQGGYPAAVVPGFPTVANPEDVERHFALLEREGVVGVKVTIEDGPQATIWPLYTPEVSAAIRAGAAARDLPIYAHAFVPRDQLRALDELGASVMVHTIEREDDAVISRLAADHIPEMSTLSPFEAFRYLWRPELLDDPLIRLTVPEPELAVVRDRRLRRKFLKTFLHTLAPSAPFPGLLSRATRPMVAAHLRRMSRALGALHAAGGEVVMGSDAGNWPLFPFLFHGPTSIRELELLVQAGLSPEQALLASTRAPARMLKMDQEIGVLRVGAVADMVVVEGDPLTDVAALRHVRWTVKAGEARSPEGWMEGAR